MNLPVIIPTRDNSHFSFWAAPCSHAFICLPPICWAQTLQTPEFYIYHSWHYKHILFLYIPFTLRCMRSWICPLLSRRGMLRIFPFLGRPQLPHTYLPTAHKLHNHIHYFQNINNHTIYNFIGVLALLDSYFCPHALIPLANSPHFPFLSRVLSHSIYICSLHTTFHISMPFKLCISYRYTQPISSYLIPTYMRPCVARDTPTEG